jgi:hypothetical protein
MHSRRTFLRWCALSGLALRAQQPAPQRWIYVIDEFGDGTGGWLPGFSDYSLLTSPADRAFEVRALPAGIDPRRPALYVRSPNPSDDVFMFIKKPVTARDGLAADRLYRISFYLEFGSNAPSGCAGIGGAPGEAVTLKAGASTVEPVATLSGQNVMLNIDKGNQDTGGRDASVTGHIGNGLPCEPGGPAPWVLLKRTHEHPEPVRTDGSGTLWLVVGADSGFEGTTSLYFATIVVLLTLQG